MKLIFIICVVLCVESFCQTAEDWKSIGIFYYSRFQKDEIDIRKTTNLNGFDKDRSTKLLIHGYIANRNHISMHNLRNAYLIKGTDNLLIADWSEVAKLFYNIPRRSVGRVGRVLGKQLKDFMMKKKIEPSNVHVLGHSLGAHIAGNLGKYFEGKIGRITGLDPAGVLFREQDDDAIKETDAVFVDIIHTAGDSAGELISRGTVDFYPNRGFGNQPGCKSLDLITGYACSHFRAQTFYAESILRPKAFPCVKCDVDEIINSGESCLPKYNPKILENLAYMGEEISLSLSGAYYLETNNVPPYGNGNYSFV